MSNTRYLLLTDEKNNGEVIKQVGRTFFSFVNSEWKKRGISAGYFLPEALEYECYKEISEDEAMKILAPLQYSKYTYQNKKNAFILHSLR